MTTAGVPDGDPSVARRRAADDPPTATDDPAESARTHPDHRYDAVPE